MTAAFTRWLLAGIALSLTALAGEADARTEKPLWEAGLGATVLSFPDYLGSDRQRSYVLPLPYFVYRGEIFQADRDGVRGVLFDNSVAELNLSVSASLPVDSDGNDARRGMPNLDPTFEIGPSLEIHLWRSRDRRMLLDLRLPVRKALAIGGSFRDAGLVFTPKVNLDIEDPLGFTGWNLGLLAGADYGNQRQHAYFYDVAPAFATADRPAYRADGGFGGLKVIAALSKRFDRFWIGCFARYDRLQDAVFADSPLIRQDHAWAAGLGIAWILGQSSKTLRVRD
ncbi:MipA/OmpV family protein [Thiorhodococcus mannitoliphagus]|uniref:MipA/OmpV family protein n=1 Tax=Thiorhodococcus mannitoliphagus TaxID=329406 RepID=A0A6P1E185_9GAMM|nr:MipA/OmpV family protein [Thiorhodococcus mannitoliphagus]NEX21744.1 MipA/OmpV family protein [Thiorhodococcus mannitoliphagus]